jgi:hypothetical protein
MYALDTHSSQDNGSSFSTTVVVTLTGVQLGDLITVEFGFTGFGGNSLVSVADNVNPGNYLAAAPAHLNATNDFIYGIYYMPNSQAGTITITLTFALSVANGAMAAQAWLGGAQVSPLDVSFSQQQDGTTANPTTGSVQTPSGTGELVIALCGLDTKTATVGANFTFIDTLVGELLYPAFWIQTSPTATNAPYVAAADSWTDQMAAFIPSLGQDLFSETLAYKGQ